MGFAAQLLRATVPSVMPGERDRVKEERRVMHIPLLLAILSMSVSVSVSVFLLDTVSTTMVAIYTCTCCPRALGCPPTVCDYVLR